MGTRKKKKRDRKTSLKKNANPAVDETISRILSEKKKPSSAANGSIDDERELLEAKEVFALSKIDIQEPKLKKATKAVRTIILISLPVIGILSVLFFIFGLPALLKDREQKIKTLTNAVEKNSRELSSLRENEEIQKNLLFDYRLQFDRYRIQVKKESIDSIKDVDMSAIVDANLARFRSTIGTNRGRSITRGSTKYRRIALTFDLGTGTDIAQLHAIVKKLGIVVTVFISNETPRKGSGSLLRTTTLKHFKLLADAGCEFGNHTWSHYDLVRSLYETSYKTRVLHPEYTTYPLTAETMSAQFTEVEKKYFTVTGKNISKIWRAPYGKIDQDIVNAAASAGYPVHVLWTVDLNDYVPEAKSVSYDPEKRTTVTRQNDQYFTSAQMLAYLINREKTDPLGMNGVITLCHLGSAREKDKMIDMLPKFIEHYLKRGYKFVTVSDIIGEEPKHYIHLK
ncbi:MAG: polysaccharide deacetylase family protein [Spirochaetes bacterium]|nr:polysaccharide deacetylase family protein [Spirochaetota bacterium]